MKLSFTENIKQIDFLLFDELLSNVPGDVHRPAPQLYPILHSISGSWTLQLHRSAAPAAAAGQLTIPAATF